MAHHSHLMRGVRTFALFGVVGLTVGLTTLPGMRAPEARTTLDVPDPKQMAMLVHSTVTALDQANKTGNYAVLRSLAAPAFQRHNTPDRLAQIFAQLRGSNVNLAPAVLYDPLLVRPAWLDANGHLRLEGFYPTRPMRVHFNLSFRQVGRTWRLFGLSVSPRAAPSES
ncbi:MAG: hypothetical protein AAGJ70_08375 [Pseudomonadota bacterium]